MIGYVLLLPPKETDREISQQGDPEENPSTRGMCAQIHTTRYDYTVILK